MQQRLRFQQLHAIGWEDLTVTKPPPIYGRKIMTSFINVKRCHLNFSTCWVFCFFSGNSVFCKIGNTSSYYYCNNNNNILVYVNGLWPKVLSPTVLQEIIHQGFELFTCQWGHSPLSLVLCKNTVILLLITYTKSLFIDIENQSIIVAKTFPHTTAILQIFH